MQSARSLRDRFPKKILSQKGFTLLEVVVTTVVMGVAFIVVGQMFIMIDVVNRESRNYIIASEYAQLKMEHYRNAGYNAIPASLDFSTTLPPQLNSPRSGTLTFTDTTPISSGLKQLNIIISYQEGNRTKQVQLTTLVAQRGIDR
jgi:prepilin-type N-terminal cleavage/methylation domain-containing protein